MTNFSILHRTRSGNVAGAVSDFGLICQSAEAPVWTTCLREMAFLEEDLSQVSIGSVKGVEIRQDQEALLFLLEVLCGLHSPVLGETEVMGQFKTYLATLPSDHILYRDPRFLPFVQHTVKEARTKFLPATGALSYGQIVRRWLKDTPDVTLWGFGSLGSEIWPWIREKTNSVVVKKMRAVESIPFVVGGEAKASAHVIAAPLSDEKVRELSDGSSLVIDLRDNSSSSGNVRSLHELFAEIQKLKKTQADLLPAGREFLRTQVDVYFSHHQIRPFGWEDLCG